jgi:regulator of cell morphogenesis and NO signaling
VNSPIDPETTVAALVLERPGRARVFERFEIDYCCGGKTPLSSACADRGLELDVVLGALEDSGAAADGEVDWSAASLEELCDHIVNHHHAYLREELPPLRLLVAKVARAHGDAHPELLDVDWTFDALADDLERHLPKEEQVLFPACIALERGDPGLLPSTIATPISALLDEHDTAAVALSRIRRLTNGYEPPADACNSYRAMLDRLETLEADTHRHMHEENNVLFPRAVALEAEEAKAA